jgi:predicted dehydrogenase
MTLRGAISGFGEVAARAHLPGWWSRAPIKIVAIHDPAAARRHHAINLIKGIRVYDDLELMLDAEALDFVDIASPPAFHARAARQALEAGVNVIVEKPLCLDAREFTELAALAARNARSLMCVHNWKYSPACLRAHQLISSGRLGTLQHLSLVRIRSQPAGEGGYPDIGGERWRLDPKAGGGILIDHGWHAFYLAFWLMGGEIPLAVSGRLGLTPEVEVDDLADLTIEFQGGRTVSIYLSWRAAVRRTSAMILGSEASLEIEGERILLTHRSAAVEDHSVLDSPEDSYHAAWFTGAAADFERVLSEGPQCEIARINLREVEVALALMTATRNSAAQNGSAIDLNFPE